MKVRVGNSIPYLLVLFATILVAYSSYLISYSEESSDKLLLTVSSKNYGTKDSIFFALTDRNGVQYNVEELPAKSAATITKLFEVTDTVNELAITFHAKGAIELQGISLACGAYSKHIPAKDIPTFFNINSPYELIQDDVLKLTGTNGSMGIGIKKFIDLRVYPVYYYFIGAAAALVLIVGLWMLIKFRPKPLNFGINFSIAAVLALLMYYLLFWLQVRIKNTTIGLNVQTNDKSESAEVYYSTYGEFNPLHRLHPEYHQPDSNVQSFQLPDSTCRYLRIDFPEDDTLELAYINISNWLQHKHISGQSLFDLFPMLNDIEYEISSSGNLILYTGSNDPFIQMLNPPFQRRWLLVQLIKSNYPVWISVFAFLIFLFLLGLKVKRQNMIFLILLLSVLLIPGMLTLLKEDNKVNIEEKRSAAQWPDSLNSIKSYTKQINDYVNDQFGGRSKMITYLNAFKVIAYKQTNNLSPVIIGKDGWMFYRAEGVQEMYENKHPISQDTLEKIRSVLVERHRWLQHQGIAYFVVFPPLKHTMYEEKLPKRIKRYYAKSKLDQVIDYLREHTNLHIIDLRQILFQAKELEKQDIYYKYDSHWNLLGGYYGYRQIVDSIYAHNPRIGQPKERTDFIWTESPSDYSDLLQLLALNNLYHGTDIVSVSPDGYVDRRIPGRTYPTYVSMHPVETYATGDSTKMKLMVNRDSYCNFIRPYLSEHFNKSIYLWTPLFNSEIIRHEKPDIFITEMLERFILDLTIDNPSILKEDLARWEAEQ